MSFVKAFNNLPFEALLSRAATTDGAAPRAVLDRGVSSLADFATLLSPAASGHLEELCRRSQTLTRQRFGRTIRLFAPLYLSNECINNCAYCGFSRDNPILRVTLSVEEVERKGVGPHY
jgi:2-iminoacetate synthase